MQAKSIYITLDDFLDWYIEEGKGRNVCGYVVSYDYDENEVTGEKIKLIAVILILRVPLHKVEKYWIHQDWIQSNVEYLEANLEVCSNIPKPSRWKVSEHI